MMLYNTERRDHIDKRWLITMVGWVSLAVLVVLCSNVQVAAATGGSVRTLSVAIGGWPVDCVYCNLPINGSVVEVMGEFMHSACAELFQLELNAAWDDATGPDTGELASE